MAQPTTNDEALARKLAKKEGITPAAAVQKLAAMRQAAAELKELEQAQPEPVEALTPNGIDLPRKKAKE